MSSLAITRGQLVARRREREGLSQEELARICLCSVRTISRVERGDNESMTQRIRSAISKRLGIPLRDLGNVARRGGGA